MTFIAAGNVQTWFSGRPPYGGCNSNSGYKSFLTADDDDGNLNNGTPHMQAIFNAFNKQEIACSSPTVQDSGCVGTPNTAPIVTATPGDMRVTITWTSITGAAKYQVYRAEGVSGCKQGKVMVAVTSSLTFTDTGLKNGREYYYIVIPKGPNESCFGPSSSCISVTPNVIQQSGTGKWYVNWQSEKCVQDCEPAGNGSCGGQAKPWDFLFDSETECCLIKLPYKHLGWCEERSQVNPYHGSGQYYVDHRSK